MQIDFVDLKRQNKKYWDELMNAIESVVRDANFIQGAKLEKFERDFARFCGKKYSVGLNSGTDALFLALLAYGIGDGDEVITAANSYFASAQTVSQVGAKPILVDVDKESFNIDVDQIKGAITKRTRAIVPVHLYGQPTDMDPIMELAKKHDLIVIEDACQAHGAKYKGKVVPVGETGAFSFYPGKNLGSFGDGGALVTDSKKIAEKVLYLRNDGSKEKYVHKSLGYKSRLDTLQAAILNVKLKYLNSWTKKRRSAANLYNKYLAGIEQIKTPQEMDYAYHVYHLYVIECPRRNALKKHLANNGVSTVIHYPTPIHLQEAYADQGYRRGSFPVTEKKAKHILSLPMFPEITEKEVIYVTDKIRDFYAL
jgi:dTDP-4-amino-4,6-dideoxygalactose transaminase